MVLTGNLVASMSSKSRALRFMNKTEIQIAPDFRGYPFMLHHGAKKAGRKGRGGYPARPFLVWTEAADRKAAELAEQFVRTQTDKVNKGLAQLEGL